MIVVANKVQQAALLEISRKDFEGSIERKIDMLVPFEPKVASQAAKLGKPFAEVGKGTKSLTPIGELAARITAITDSGEHDDKAERAAKGAKANARGASLLSKLTSFKDKMPKKAKK